VAHGKTGDWNIALLRPRRVAADVRRGAPPPISGLEWEPCHQLCELIDPMPQLRTWVPKNFSRSTARMRRCTGDRDPEKMGFRGPQPRGRITVTRDSATATGPTSSANFRRHGFKGAIDIEGWHDPVYRADLEMTGQVRRAQLPQALPRRALLCRIPCCPVTK